MPHQCVRCNKMYSDGSIEIIKGCTCSGKLFFYLREEAVKKSRGFTENLTAEEKIEMERDIFDILGVKEEEPVVLDIEAIRILKPGKFEIDLVHLFKSDEPLVYQLGDGKYVIDLAESFSKLKKKN